MNFLAFQSLRQPPLLSSTSQAEFPHERGCEVGVGEDGAAAPYRCWCHGHCEATY